MYYMGVEGGNNDTEVGDHRKSKSGTSIFINCETPLQKSILPLSESTRQHD